MPLSMKYLDFDLHIWREGDQYAFEVTDSPGGRSKREYCEEWPFPEPAEDLLKRVEEMVRTCGPARRGPIPTPAETFLKEFGAGIFKVVFEDAKSVGTAYIGSLAKLGTKGTGTGLRINLSVEPPEWASLPWEYVFEHDYLCLDLVSPIVRRMDTVRGARRIADEDQAPSRLRVLGMLVNLGGDWSLPDAEKERRELEEAMAEANVDFRWVPRPTPDGLMDMIQKGPWDIFHFIGHGGIQSEADATGKSHSLGYVVMDNGFGMPRRFWADVLAMYLGSGNIKLAVMNCCDSGRGGQSNSVGEALVAAGIPMAIAMQFRITDASAARFANRFYKSLTCGETTECALTFARQSMKSESDAEWAIPIMFTQTAPRAFFKAGVEMPVSEDASTFSPPPLDATRAQAKAELKSLWKQT